MKKPITIVISDTMNVSILILLELVCRFQEIRTALGIPDNNYEIVRVKGRDPSKWHRSLGLPKGELITVKSLEAAGFVLLCHADGNTKDDDGETKLTKAMKAANESNPLRFLVNQSGILEDQQLRWLGWFLTKLYKLNETGESFVKLKTCDMLMRKALPKQHQRTPRTVRDIQMLVRWLNVTTPEEQRDAVWNDLLALICFCVDAARAVFTTCGQKGIELKKWQAEQYSIFIPELWEGVDWSRFKAVNVAAVFEDREAVFQKGEQLFKEGKMAATYSPFTADAAKKTPRFARHSRAGDSSDVYHGTVILARCTAPADSPVSFLVSTLARGTIQNEFNKNQGSLRYAPLMMVRFYEVGKFHFETSSKEDESGEHITIDPTVIVAGVRKLEVQKRTDLSDEEKWRILSNPALLSERGTPSYGAGKKSHIVFANNGLTFGNMYSDPTPALPVQDNSEIIEAMKEAIRSTYTL